MLFPRENTPSQRCNCRTIVEGARAENIGGVGFSLRERRNLIRPWRWKGQFNENSKHLAWVSSLPEMNHNEVDGFVNPGSVIGKIAAVLLRDPDDHPRIARRFDWLARYLGKRNVHVETVMVEGGDPMSRMLGGVSLGDFVSYYLALLNGADPSALPGVTALKRSLQK